MTLMIAWSNTAEGAAALEQGRELATRLQTDVVVFALDREAGPDGATLDSPPDVAVEGERWVGSARVSQAPAGDLLDTAHGLDVEGIVVGIRRRSPVGKLIMGSQAQQVILGANVPVIAVKAPAVHE